MPNPKRHHYLPRFYLKRFAAHDLLWVYDRQQQRLRHEHPNSIAVERYYYSLTNGDGTKDHLVEEWLAKVEGFASPVFDKIENRKSILPEERFFLSLFLGVLYCRVPRHEREMNEILTGESRTLLRRNLLDPFTAKSFTSGTPAELLSYVESEKYGLKFDRDFVIAGLAECGRELGKFIFIADWTVLHAESCASFATCDVPFGIIDADRLDHPVGVASPEALKVVPLSSRTALMFNGAGAGVQLQRRKARAGEVRRINLTVLRETETYAIARDEQHLRSLAQRAGLTEPTPLTRMVVDDLPHPSGDPLKSISVVRRARRSQHHQQAGPQNSWGEHE